MAQIKYSANLSAADFTLSLDFKGQSVIVPGPDQNYFQATSDWAGNTPQRGANIPQVMYCENTVPTAEGYKSVAYKYFVNPPTPERVFAQVFNLFEGHGASALLGLTADMHLYGLSANTDGEWQEAPLGTLNPDDPETPPDYPTPPAWTTPGQVTTTTWTDFSLVCIQGVGIFGFDYSETKLRYLPVAGIDQTQINGICSSSGYLIAWDDANIYWSGSNTSDLDFTPSLITGAGGTRVEGLKGHIQLCKEINGGFIIYTDVTIISAAYTTNSQLPWNFEVLAGGAGVREPQCVTQDINSQVHFAWTVGGLVGVELQQCRPLFPFLTDFIASELSDSSATLQSYPTITFNDEYKAIRLAVVSGRYLCVSLGQYDPTVAGTYLTCQLTQSFLYDLQLKRWGKLNIAHAQIVETPFLAKSPTFF